MPRSGRPKAVLVLTDEEREQLSRWARRAKSSQALALRSRIVLACAEGTDNKTVAAQLGCAAATVGKWRARFVEARLDDAWYLLDATNLAPRQAMVRIATGRDAADTAFMTVNAGGMNFTGMRVTAVRDPDLPVDDITTLVRLP